MNVAVVGLGRLGTPLLAVLGANGHRVVGVDVRADAVDAINQGHSPVEEPGVDELLLAAGARVSASTNYDHALASVELVFIVVPTPTGPDGGFLLDSVLAAVKDVGAVLRRTGQDCLVVITSTVMPGSTSGPIRATLEASAGRPVGSKLGLCYSPEFIALGTVVHDLLNPDMILIGECETGGGATLEAVLSSLTRSAPPVVRMSATNAEIAKLAVNTFVTTKISYANMLGQICGRIDGADVDAVTRAVGHDSRIGPKYLKAGTAFGGPCFPRDNLALSALARRLGVPALVAEATQQTNTVQVEQLIELVVANLPVGGHAGILGLAYKPGTSVTDESAGLNLARRLIELGVPTVVYDPGVKVRTATQLLPGARIADSIRDCVMPSDLVVIATPWPEFGSLEDEGLTSERSRVIVDCWRMLVTGQLQGLARVIRVGVGASREGT